MGTHGRGAIGHLLMGSVAERSRADCALSRADGPLTRARVRDSGRHGVGGPLRCAFDTT